MSEDRLELASAFPQADREAWLALVEQMLKGAPFEKRLVSKTYDDLAIQPLYTHADWGHGDDRTGLPGLMPFTRGAQPAGHVAAGWDIRQGYAHPDLASSNAAMRTDVARGVTSLLLQCDAAARTGLDPDDPAAVDLAGQQGLMVYSTEDFDTLLQDIALEQMPIALEPGAQFVPLAAMLMALWQRRGVPAATARGALHADPLAVLAMTGELPAPITTMLQQMADLAAYTARTYPHVTSIGVDSRPYHGAGATEAQDLACSMATAVTYLRALTDTGMDIDTACRQMTFSYAVGPDVFLSIAKLRVARRLWARITEASGAAETARAMQLHVDTAPRVMSQRDPWVNLLRTTVACFAAAVAGADSITVSPYDAALGLPDDLARRIARNTQLILQEESGLHRVIDPAGGAWYVEHLSEALAQEAWAKFQHIETAGGMVQALLQGTVADMIAASQAERSRNIARRKEPLTGVSEFPNILEPSVTHAPPDRDALRQHAIDRITRWRSQHDVAAAVQAVAAQATATSGALTAAMVQAAAAGATVGALAKVLPGQPTRIDAFRLHRLAEDFEALRDASDAHLAHTGTRPAVCLVNLGTAAQYTARATFAKNFFEAGGIQAVPSEDVDGPQAAAAAFTNSGARIAVLCSSDALYEQQVEAIAPALKQAGAAWLFLAGNPGAKRQAYVDAGMDEFIYLGGEVLAVLRATLSRLGVPQI